MDTSHLKSIRTFDVDFATNHGLDKAIVYDFMKTYIYLTKKSIPSDEILSNQFPFWAVNYTKNILLELKNDGFLS